MKRSVSVPTWRIVIERFGASRGLSVSDSEKVYRWFNGPESLRSPGVIPLHMNGECEIPDDDPEVIVQVKSNAVQTGVDAHVILNSLGERVSSWVRMVRLLTALILFVRFFCGKMER